jgi:hypothetical protein
VSPGERDDRLRNWGLSAPELCVLRREGRGDGREALRMAVLELIVRGALRLDFGGRSRRYVSVQRTDVGVHLDPPVAAVAACLGSAPMSLRSLEHELSLMWATPHEFVWSEVVPALCDRGVAQRMARRRGLRWMGNRLVLTECGRTARAQLGEQLTVLEERLGGWLAEDAAGAVAYVAEAGAAVLLAPAAWRHVARLYACVPAQRASGASGMWETAVYASMRVTALDPAFDFSILGGLDNALGGWADGGGSGDGGDGGGGGGD